MSRDEASLRPTTSLDSSRSIRRVLLISSAFDPISLGDLRLATELFHHSNADEVLLVPFGCDYRSIDPSLDAFHRFVLASLAVDACLTHDIPVRVVSPTHASKPTWQILDALGKATVGTNVAYTLFLSSNWARMAREGGVKVGEALSAAHRLTFGKMLRLQLCDDGSVTADGSWSSTDALTTTPHPPNYPSLPTPPSPTPSPPSTPTPPPYISRSHSHFWTTPLPSLPPLPSIPASPTSSSPSSSSSSSQVQGLAAGKEVRRGSSSAPSPLTYSDKKADIGGGSSGGGGRKVSLPETSSSTSHSSSSSSSSSSIAEEQEGDDKDSGGAIEVRSLGAGSVDLRESSVSIVDSFFEDGAPAFLLCGQGMTFTASNIDHFLVHTRIAHCSEVEDDKGGGEKRVRGRRKRLLWSLLAGLLPKVVLQAIVRYGLYTHIRPPTYHATSSSTAKSLSTSPSPSSLSSPACEYWKGRRITEVEVNAATPHTPLPLPTSSSSSSSLIEGEKKKEDGGGEGVLSSTLPSSPPSIPPPPAASTVAREDRIRVAVLGGSFHPITNAHLLAAAEVLYADVVDEVWVIPCGSRPDKASLTMSTALRYLHCVEAIEEMFDENTPIRAVPAELYTTRALSSHHLLSTLHYLHPTCSFSLVIGTDLVPTLPKWQHSSLLLEHSHFIILPRPGYLSNYKSTTTSTKPPSSHLSPSTKTRSIVKEEEREEEEEEEEGKGTRKKKKKPTTIHTTSAQPPAPHIPYSTVLTPVHSDMIASMRLSSSEIRRRLAKRELRQSRESARETKRASFVQGLLPAVVVSAILRYNLYLGAGEDKMP